MSELDIRSGLSVEEIQRLERIDRIDSNKKRKKLIFAGVTVVLILFFVLGTVFGGMHILSYEGTQALPPGEVSYPALPLSEKEIIDSFISLTKDTESFDSIKLDVSFDVNVPDDSISLEGENAENTLPLLSHIRSSAVSVISDMYSSQRHSGKYGEDFSGNLYNIGFTADEVEAEYKIGEENENDLEYIFNFGAEENITDKVFSMDAAEDVISLMTEKLGTMAEISGIKRNYESFVMTAKISREENILTGVEQKRICNVTVPLEFVGEYASLGEMTLSFKLELTKRFNFTRVKIYFYEDVFYIEKGSSDELKAKVITDQSPADIDIVFTSSAPEILSVDGSFYKGEKVSEKPVTVTAEYTYNGITYKDSCEYYVRIPVEGVKLEEKEISLKTGETKNMVAVISPHEATLKNVFWFTTDENTVSVDENGVITAKAEGSASVYCITLDGNFKSSCIVEVKG